MKSKPMERRTTSSEKSTSKIKKNKRLRRGPKSKIGRESGNGSGRARTDSSQCKLGDFFNLEVRGTPLGVETTNDANELI